MDNNISLFFYEKCKECANAKTVSITGNAFCETNTFCTKKMPHFCYIMSTECWKFKPKEQVEQQEKVM